MPKGYLSYPADGEVKTDGGKEKGNPDFSPHTNNLPGEGRGRPVIYPLELVIWGEEPRETAKLVSSSMSPTTFARAAYICAAVDLIDLEILELASVLS